MSDPKRFLKRKSSSINPILVSAASKFETNPKHGYYGFKLYFPDESTSVDKILKSVRAFENFLQRNSTLYCLQTVEQRKWFTVDYKFLLSEPLVTEWVDFRNQIVNCTELTLNCMGLAVHQAVIKSHLQNHDIRTEEEEKYVKYVDIIRARLVNFDCIPIKDIRVQYFGKLVSVQGTVIKAGDTKVLPQCMAFSCSACTGEQIIMQTEGVYTVPKKCTTSECKAQSNFKPLYSSPHSRTVPWQSIKIQELIGSNQFETGKVPRSLECELTSDLINSCIPGDDITLTGIVKLRNENTGKSRQQSSTFQLYLLAVSVINNKNQSQGAYGAAERISFNTNDYYAIQTIHSEPQLFRFLVQSLSPNIYGHEIVKAGLLLALFGGTKSPYTRAESHVLMVGDPGLGKSQMLQACTNVAPRGIYVCGNTSTNSGLTVTLTRGSKGEYALEAGALMLADQGCCCIDEFDKMPTQHACLLEAMEQQTISIAKAGTVCSLPARTTIFAAANPGGGHYNKAKTVAENLKISSPMLSRFDLIFILLDQPNEELDVMLTKHVLAQHSGFKKGKNSAMDTTFFNSTGTDTLKDRLRLKNGEEIDHLPHNLFRKYIAYAQKYVNPKLSEEAKKVLKNYYLALRRQFQSGNCTPITTRQLNSLIRLSQARAKAELREIVTAGDAQEVTEIMKESLIEIFSDETGLLDKTRSQNSSGMSTKNQAMKLLQAMQEKTEADANPILTTDEISKLSLSVGICKSKFYTVLDNLNIQGFILSKGNKRYQLVTASM